MERKPRLIDKHPTSPNHVILEDMAQLERTEGDYTYWSDGAQRYAKGNSLGKQAGALAKRHPQATSFTKANATEHGANGIAAKRMKRDERRKTSLRSLQQALLLHPDSANEQDGLRLLWEARVEQAADSEGGSAAVKSHKMLEEAWSGSRQDDKVVDARQIHITLSPGSGTDLSRFAQLMDITEDETRDVEDDE